MDTLADGRFWPAAGLFAADERDDDVSGTGWVLMDFDEPTSAASVRIGLPAQHVFGSSPAPAARLEASDDGSNFRTVVDLPASLPRPLGSFPNRDGALLPAFPRGAGRFRLPGSAWSQTSEIPCPARAGTSFRASGLQLFAGPRIHRAEEKAGYAPVPDFYALERGPSEALPEVQPEEILDLERPHTPTLSTSTRSEAGPRTGWCWTSATFTTSPRSA